MSRYRFASLAVGFVVFFTLFNTSPVASAAEWSYSGKCQNPRDVYSGSGIPVKINIKGNANDPALLVELDFKSVQGIDDGSYHPATGQFRTKFWNGHWDKDKRGFMITLVENERYNVEGCLLTGDKAPPGFDRGLVWTFSGDCHLFRYAQQPAYQGPMSVEIRGNSINDRYFSAQMTSNNFGTDDGSYYNTGVLKLKRFDGIWGDKEKEFVVRGIENYYTQPGVSLRCTLKGSEPPPR